MPSGPGPAPVELVRPLLQHLADVAARVEGESPRPVPELAPHAVGDQLAVLARDVLALAPRDGTGPGAPTVAGEPGRNAGPGARVLDDAALADVADRLTALRRALP